MESTFVKQLRSILTEGAEQMDIRVSSEQTDALLDYLELLNKWNKTYNLTAVKDPVNMVSRHLLDSLSILHYIDGLQILDVGSGPGLPGIPLAILKPESTFTLLDSNGKKKRFMDHAIRSLQLPNVIVKQERVEAWHTDNLFDNIISRAFSALIDMVSLTEHLLKENGVWVAMKGQYREDEVFALQKLKPRVVVKGVVPLSVPGNEGCRNIIMLERFKPE